MAVWPAERHPTRWDVDDANRAPAPDLTERFRSALLYGEDDELVSNALSLDLDEYVWQDSALSLSGYTYPMVLLSSLPKLPSDYDLSITRQSYAQIFEDHVFVKDLGLGSLVSSASPPYLQLATACIAAAVSNKTSDQPDGDVALELFHAGSKLWTVMVEVDNREARNAKAILAALLLSTYGALSHDTFVKMKTSALICNIATMCRRLRLTDPALSAYTTLNVTDRDLAGKSSLLCYMLLVDTIHALQTNDIPKYSISELAFAMPSSKKSFRTTYTSLLHGYELPDDLSATEDALLLLTALLADILYTQRSIDRLLMDVQSLPHCSPYRPLCAETDMADRRIIFRAALDRWEARFGNSSQDILALLHLARLQLMIPDLTALLPVVHGHEVTPEATELAWLILANVENSPRTHGKKLSIWLPAVLHSAGIVIWRAHVQTDRSQRGLRTLALFADAMLDLPWPSCTHMSAVLKQLSQPEIVL